MIHPVPLQTRKKVEEISKREEKRTDGLEPKPSSSTFTTTVIMSIVSSCQCIFLGTSSLSCLRTRKQVMPRSSNSVPTATIKSGCQRCDRRCYNLACNHNINNINYRAFLPRLRFFLPYRSERTDARALHRRWSCCCGSSSEGTPFLASGVALISPEPAQNQEFSNAPE